MINEKIIDTHMHIDAWENDEYKDFVDCFEGHREQGATTFNICSLPSPFRSTCNNIMLALYKIAHPNTYAHANLDHIKWPITDDMPTGMDLVTQYKELMAIGFDGMKFIEGKPTQLKPNGNNLNHIALDRVYCEMEKDGTHIVFHINDPDTFWDKDKLSSEHIEKGWFYGDGTYLTYEEIQRQALELLERHPRLNITLAHFFFCSKTPEILEELFAKYPSLCVDLTPGCEMYHAFEEKPKYFKEFFTKYSDRVMLGTDGTFPWSTKSHAWCLETLYKYITTSESMMAFDDSILTGIKIEGEAKENILYKNFERRVGVPRKINKDALISYINKYKCLLSEDEIAHLAPYIRKYLGEI